MSVKAPNSRKGFETDLKRTCNGLVTDLQHCPQTANTQHLSPITQNPDCKITKIFSLCQRLMKKNITFLGRSLCVILREKHVETQLLRLFYIDLTFFYVFNMVVPFFFRNFVRENINKYLTDLKSNVVISIMPLGLQRK